MENLAATDRSDKLTARGARDQLIAAVEPSAPTPLTGLRLRSAYQGRWSRLRFSGGETSVALSPPCDARGSTAALYLQKNE